MKPSIKKAQTFALVAAILSVSACSSPMSAKLTPAAVTIGQDAAIAAGGVLDSTPVGAGVNAGCGIFNSSVWMLNVARSMYLDAKLTTTEKRLMDDAQLVLSAGCDPSNPNSAAKLVAASRALVQVVYKQ